MSIPEYVEKYNNIGNGEHLEDDTVNLAGIEIRAFIYLVSIYHVSFGDFLKNFLSYARAYHEQTFIFFKAILL